MSPRTEQIEQHEIFVLVEPEDAELFGLLARRRPRRIAMLAVLTAILGVGTAVGLATRCDPGVENYAVLAPGQHAVRTTHDPTPEPLEPVHVPVLPRPAAAQPPRETGRTPEALPAPAPPAPVIEAAPSRGAQFAGASAPISTRDEIPPFLDALALKSEPTPDGKWVITLRNGSVFVVEHAEVTERWVTLWVENGVVELPMDYLSAHGRRRD